MAKIICISSFRRGAGKSTLAVNLAASLAQHGRRVGVIDADTLSPRLHWLIGSSKSEDEKYTLTDYLLKQHTIDQAVRDKSARLGPDAQGRLFFVPANDDAVQISQLLHQGYAPELLADGCQQLIKNLALDVVVIDTHAGLDQNSLATMAMSDTLLVVMRLDKSDYQGTAVTIDVARQLEIPSLSLIVNLVSPNFSLSEVKAEAEHTYRCAVSAVLPAFEEVMTHADSGIFVLEHPHHHMAIMFNEIADRLSK